MATIGRYISDYGVGAIVARDEFQRTVAAGSTNWGTATSGQAWSNGSGGGAQVSPGFGRLAGAVPNTSYSQILNIADTLDLDETARVAWDATAAGGATFPLTMWARYTDANNAYRVELRQETTGAVNLQVRRIVASTQTVIGALTQVAAAYTLGTSWYVRLRLDGDRVRAKAWHESAAEPSAWLFDINPDTTPYSVAGDVGLRGQLTAASTSAPTNFDYRGYMVVAPISDTTIAVRTPAITGATFARSVSDTALGAGALAPATSLAPSTTFAPSLGGIVDTVTIRRTRGLTDTGKTGGDTVVLTLISTRKRVAAADTATVITDTTRILTSAAPPPVFIPPVGTVIGGPRTTWHTELFNLGGDFIGILKPNQPKLSFVFNGIDSYSWAMRLEDPLADEVQPLETIVKVWRRVGDQVVDSRYPSFAGIVGPISEGSGNVVNFTAYSPLWRLQSRFVWTRLEYKATDQSRIVWNLIDYTNTRAGAGGPGATGIILGTIPTSVDRDRAYDRGQNIWSAITDLNGLGGFDLAPRYVHLAGQPQMLEFNTLPINGAYRPLARVDYHVGANNCDDMTRQIGVDPGVFATQVREEGQGDTGAAPFVARPVAPDIDPAILRYGLYERWDQADNVQDTVLLGDMADETLAQSATPLATVQPTISPVKPPYYGVDYLIGDMLPVAANRGRMRFNVPLRVYQADLSLTDNNLESVQLTMTRDLSETVVVP
jgi:hypothetical protein